MEQTLKWLTIDEIDKYNGMFLLFSPYLIDEDFNPEGVVEGYFQDDAGWIATIWCPIHDHWTEEIVYPTHFMHKPSTSHLIQEAKNGINP